MSTTSPQPVSLFLNREVGLVGLDPRSDSVEAR
jgi:hypothetical protein